MEFSTAIQKAFDLACPPQERVWRLAALVRAITDPQDGTSPIPGVFVECGVWRGGLTVAMAAAAPDRLVFAFDTFAGMPKVSEHDQHHEGDFAVPIEEVNATTAEFKNIFLIKGDICSTVPAFNTPEIALLVMDCDLYAPHKVALEHLYPKMASGGVIVLDDYTTTDCKGARKAADDIFTEDQIKKKFGFWTVTK